MPTRGETGTWAGGWVGLSAGWVRVCISGRYLPDRVETCRWFRWTSRWTCRQDESWASLPMPKGRLTFCACALCACANLPVSLVSAYRTAGPCACLVTSPFAAEAGGRQTSPNAGSRAQPCNWGRLGPNPPQLHGTTPNPANGGLEDRAQNHAFGEVSDPTFPRGRGGAEGLGPEVQMFG